MNTTTRTFPQRFVGHHAIARKTRAWYRRRRGLFRLGMTLYFAAGAAVIYVFGVALTRYGSAF